MKAILPIRTLLFVLLLSLLKTAAFAKVFYVDAQTTITNGDGTLAKPWKYISQVNSYSDLSPFQAGDTIRFKRGCAWTQLLRPKGSGNINTRILITDYGDPNLAKPKINGGGARDEGPNASKLVTSDDVLHGGATILLQNQSFWTIENITVTNTPSSLTLSNLGLRQGIKIVADDSPATQSGNLVEEITIRGVTVEDVYGKYHFSDTSRGKETAGISLFIYRPSGSYPANQYVKAKLKNIKIEDCIIQRVTRCGIISNASYLSIHPEDHINENDYPITGLKILRNIIQECSGDGVVVRFAKDALVERNRALNNHCGVESGTQGEGYRGYVGHGVAMWCRSTTGTIFQYNHVSGTKGVKDGTAFDADMAAFGTIFQYNYSHNNEGGFMLIMRSKVADPGTIIRYNISQHDGNSANRSFHFSTFPKNPTAPAPALFDGAALIHNNTFYIEDPEYDSTDALTRLAISNSSSNVTKFFSNIFIQPVSRAILNRNTSNFGYWQYNHFTNFLSSSIPSNADNPGNTTGAHTLQGPVSVVPTITTVGVYNTSQLNAFRNISNTAPLYKTGKFVQNNGGKDFYGLTLSNISTERPNKGAHDGCFNCTPGQMWVDNAADLKISTNTEKGQKKILYPNPATDKLYLANVPKEPISVEIIDHTGRKVMSSQMANGQLSIAGLPQGAYILVFPKNSGLGSYRFIKYN